MECRCYLCGSNLLNQKNLLHHQKYCHQVTDKIQEKCRICDRQFHDNQALCLHLQKCGRYICRSCDLPFLTTEALNFHVETFHKKSTAAKSYRCGICKCNFEGRRALYTHRMRQHGGNNDDHVLPAFIVDNDDENLREIYVKNIDHIQANHQETELKNIYNFPTNNLHGGYREIRTQVREIYQNLHNAFRINLAFGTILFNNETREYFVPHYNSKILQYPFRISNMNSIRFLMNKLAGIDIITQARSDRPSTAWSLAFITNVQYVVFKTEFPLGNAEDLPDYIKQNRNLKTMYIDKWTGKPYTDNLCFFRCLRQHFKGNKDFLEYFRVWMNFKKSEKLGNSTGQFTGVTMDEMMDLERCFNVKILIYSLSPDGVVCNLYKSVNNYDSKMYLNVLENHLSYIVDINKFTKKISM